MHLGPGRSHPASPCCLTPLLPLALALLQQDFPHWAPAVPQVQVGAAPVPACPGPVPVCSAASACAAAAVALSEGAGQWWAALPGAVPPLQVLGQVLKAAGHEQSWYLPLALLAVVPGPPYVMIAPHTVRERRQQGAFSGYQHAVTMHTRGAKNRPEQQSLPLPGSTLTFSAISSGGWYWNCSMSLYTLHV
jgi:hypothetical protein